MPNTEILDEGFANPNLSALEVYDQFHTAADAKHLISVLKSNGIFHEVEVPKQIMDSLMGGDAHSPKVFVKLPLQDFELVNQLVEADMLRLIQEGKVNLKKHFLQEYSNEELLEVLRKSDEWSIDTTVIARHFLQVRGIELNQEQIKALREERIQEIRKPKKGSTGWMIVLFLLGGFGFLFFLWWYVAYLTVLVICFGMGYYFWKDVTTDPKGGRFYTFDLPTRSQGRTILILTAVTNLAFLIWFFGRNL